VRTSARRLAVLSSVVALAAAGVARAQGSGSWTTTGGDAQRTSWVRTDPKITKDAVQKGEFQFLWKNKLENEARQLNSLTQPVILPNIISYKGFKALAYIGGSSDNVYAIDYDLNRMFWKRHLNTASTAPGTLACPGGLTTIARQTPLMPPGPAAGRGGFLGARGGAGARGRGAAPGGAPGGTTPAAGAAAPAAGPPGAPGAQGAPGTLPPGAGAPAAPGAPGVRAQPGGRGAGPGQAGGRGAGGGGRGAANNNVFAISSGGMAHTLNPQTGEDFVPPAKLFGPNANVVGAILIENTFYAATAGNCGGVSNGVYAIDFGADGKSSRVTSWATKGGSVVGSAGPAFGPSGALYVATGEGQSPMSNSIVALDLRTLTQNGVFTAATAFTSSPVVFSFKDRELVVAANKDGRLYVLDGGSLGGSDQKTPMSRSAQYTSTGDVTAGALATWEDTNGTRWVLAPTTGAVKPDAAFSATNGTATNGSIVAFRLVERDGTPTLQPGWVSRDLVSPLPPTVVNGIVFAVSGGESRTGATAAERAQRSKPAVLYALDGTTGKEIWSSGTAITSFARGASPAAADSQVYVVTHDGTVYAFGIPLEH
jgi:hypothetical protein